MKKLSFKVKKNILASVLVVLVIAFGTILVASITKEHNVEDAQTLVEYNESVSINKEDSKTEKPNEDEKLNLNTETLKKADKIVKPEPPKEKPKTSDDVTNKNKVPTYPEKEVKPQIETPKLGNVNSKGQMNFPGFGEVEDSGSNKGQNVSSNGDINKQIGTMD